MFDKFCSDRIIWGSDWPVDNLVNWLTGWLEVTQKIHSRLSENECNAIGSSNTKRVYKFNE